MPGPSTSLGGFALWLALQAHLIAVGIWSAFRNRRAMPAIAAVVLSAAAAPLSAVLVRTNTPTKPLHSQLPRTWLIAYLLWAAAAAAAVAVSEEVAWWGGKPTKQTEHQLAQITNEMILDAGVLCIALAELLRTLKPHAS